MKILILSSTPWRKDNSFGNSFSNILDGVDNIEIANIYLGYGNPDDKLVSKFFQITEKSLIKNLKNKNQPSGKEVFLEKSNVSNLNDIEQKSFNSVRKKRWQIFFWARDFIWAVGRWRSPELKKFIDDFKPDLIFQPIYYSNYLSRIALFIKEYTKAPMIGYISDDNYTLHQFSLSPLYWIDRLHKRRNVKKVFLSCEYVYVISEIQKNEYKKIFKKDCKILTKCADFSDAPQLKPNYNTPRKIVYTGNLGAGRWKPISYICDALKAINSDGQKAVMYIYSATPLSKSQKNKISDAENSVFCGAVSSDEIQKIQDDADILVHVEGLDLKSRCKVHQSFSTKIVDYLYMARPIFAIGTNDEASIDYLIKNDAAVVVTDRRDVKDKLLSLIKSDEMLNEYAEKGYLSGRKNHQKSIMQKNLYDDMKQVIEN